MCVGVYCVLKTPDENDLKLGTVVVLDTMSKPVDFGFKRSRVSGTGSSFPAFVTSCQLVNKTDFIVIFYENYLDNIKLQYVA